MKQKILLAEDRNDNRKAYKLDLQEEFADAIILEASTDDEAIQFIKSEDYIDVIITDLMMNSDDSGLVILRESKAKDPLTMVIIITAYEEKLDRKEAFKLGVFDCLDKAAPGVKTSRELVYKTRSAIHSRRVSLQLLESQRNLDFMKKYFDPLVFDKINKNPEFLIPSNRTVTIVFWDIRGFSALSETLKAHPDIVASFIKEYLEIASNVIFKHNGVLDKFIGDGVMAIFGAFDNTNDPKAEEDAAKSAISAAIDFRNAFTSLYSEWRKKWERTIADTINIGLGCGIHTGNALVGNLGTDIRDHFTAIGTHVNLAARIESSSSSGEIRFSTTTKSRIENFFAIRKIESLKNIKNIRGEFDIFIIEDKI